MTISFTGLGSGMDYSSWIDALVEAKQANLTTLENKITTTEAAQTTINELQSAFTSFNSTLTTFTDSNLISAFDIFGRRQVTSSDEGKTASATVSNDATIQSFELNVLQLATSTVATGKNYLGQLATFSTGAADENTKLVNLLNGVTKGTIKISIGDDSKEFEITDDTTIKDFTNFLTSREDYEDTGMGFLTANISSDGKLSFLKQDSQHNIKFYPSDSPADGESNFLSLLNFQHTSGTNSYTSDTVLTKDSSSKLMDLNNGVITKGDISFYVNNEKKTFEVDENTTIDEFKRFLLSSDTGVGLASVDFSEENGTLSFTCQENQEVNIGTTADTSNLLDFFGFTKVADSEPKQYSSSKILTTIDTSAKIASTGNINLQGQDPTGSFKIGNETFTINSNTSINGLIYEINSNSDAGVTASYDAVANKLVLKAKDPGATTINIEAIDGCKFTDIVGWTVNGTTLADGSQHLGQNSKFKINNQTFEAASNAISEDVTGITGLTLKLNQVTKDDATAQISITSDYTEVESAIDTFIEKYNGLISDLKEASSSDGALAYDSSLRRMATEMANTIMNQVPGLSTYISFSSIGISTGSATSDVSDVSQDLVFNKSKFEEAMAKNPDEVKKLFVNEDKEDQSYSGVMVKLQNIVEGYDKLVTDSDGNPVIDPATGQQKTEKVPGYLTVGKGYFAIKSDSYEKQLETLNDSLIRKQDLIEQYRERLETQFQNMDSYISTMQSYSSYLTSALSSSSSS